MNVEIGTKMRLKDGETCDNVEKEQVVIVEREPLMVCGQMWVKFEGIEDACPLDSFEVVEDAPKTFAELQEDAQAIADKWKNKDPQSVTLADLDELKEDMDTTVTPLMGMLEDAVSIVDNLSAAKRMANRPIRPNRQQVSPRRRRPH